MSKNNYLETIYKDYSEKSDEVWRTEVQPKIEEINQRYETFFSQEDFSINDLLNQKIKKTQHAYKKSFNHFAYWMLAIFGLFLSFILIIPFYFALKKFKQLKSKKDTLSNEYENAKQEKIDFLNQKIKELNINEYYSEMINLTKYRNCGPINDSIVNYIRENSLFKLENDHTKNTLSTSWGIFDNNKIVVNLQKAEHYMINVTYSGSMTVETTVEGVYRTVTATITKPKPVFKYKNSYWFFMKSCSNLELDLEKTYPSKNRILAFKKGLLLENKEFEKSFKWEYNDPIQYRMIFTPFTQEYYVNNAFSKKEFNENFNLSKRKSFITNRYSCYSSSLAKSLFNVAQEIDTNLINIDNLIKSSLLEKVHCWYLKLTPGWILPILKSEDHSDILFTLKNAQATPNFSTFHYILNKIIRRKIVKADTDTFNTITSSFRFISSFNDEIYGVEIEGVSYNELFKTAHVYSSGYSVPVDYTEYIPVKNKKYLFMTYLKKNKWRCLWHSEIINEWYNSNFNNELEPIIEKYKNNDIYISVDKTILAVFADKLPKEKIISIFDEIIPIINKYN